MKATRLTRREDLGNLRRRRELFASRPGAALSIAPLSPLPPHFSQALLTASFDGTARVFGCRDWRLLTTLSGHEGKLMGADWGPATGRRGGGRSVLTAGYDRTLKLWASEGPAYA